MDLETQKAYSSRLRKERKTIKDGDDVLKSIVEALKDDKSAYGFTMGKVSLIQIVETICREFGGNFDLTTCIWSANKIDILRLKELQDQNFLKSAKFLVDPSAYTRKFSAIEALYSCFGIDSVRSLPTHAKFVTLKNDKFNIAITSSMNFTHNPRIEQYEVSECKDTLELMSGMVNNAFELYKPQDNFTGQAMSKFTQIKKTISKTETLLPDMNINLELNLNI